MALPETERLVLREFASDDRDALHAFVSLPEVCEHTDWGPNTLADTERFLANATASGAQVPRTELALAVVQRASGRLIGSCAIWQESRQHARGALGLVLHPDVWRQGLATEVAGMLLQLGAEQLGLQRVEATCRPENVGSRRALERAGFVVEGLLRRHVVVRGERRDPLLLAALPGLRAAG